MTTARHAPGPWVADFNGNIRQITDPSRPLMDLIVGTAFAPDELGATKFDFQRANARLIAAAPAMLEALRTIVANASSVQMDPQWAVQVARSAIAAATQE